MATEKLTSDDELFLKLEAGIPALAERAFQQAYRDALASGSSVLEVIDGKLVESAADGSTHVIKPLPPAPAVAIGVRRIRASQ